MSVSSIRGLPSMLHTTGQLGSCGNRARHPESGQDALPARPDWPTTPSLGGFTQVTTAFTNLTLSSGQTRDGEPRSRSGL